MPLLVAGQWQRYSFHWGTSDGPVSTGAANVYFQTTHQTNGARQFLQGDGISLGPVKALFPLAYNATTETWDRALQTPSSLLEERVFEAVGEHDDVDDIPMPRITKTCYVQGATTDDIYPLLSGGSPLPQDIRFKGS